MHTLNTHKRLLALTVAMALSTPAAFAAENVWESIEVTAQKRNENISDVSSIPLKLKDEESKWSEFDEESKLKQKREFAEV